MAGYISRFSASAGADHTVRRLQEARRQMEYSFREQDQREIPEVAAVFTAIDEAITKAQEAGAIFSGSGSHSTADFMPDESGETVNARQMAERRAAAWRF